MALTTVGVTGLAGCSSIDGSIPTNNTDSNSTSAPSSTPEVEGTSDQHLSNFRRGLERLSLDIRTLGVSDPIVKFAYETPETQYQAVSDQIGRVSGLFFRQLEGGWSATRLNATARVSGGTVLTWYARAEWYGQYTNSEITAEDLTLKVLETVSDDKEA